MYVSGGKDLTRSSQKSKSEKIISKIIFRPSLFALVKISPFIGKKKIIIEKEKNRVQPNSEFRMYGATSSMTN